MLSGCSSGKTVSVIDWGFQFPVVKKDWRFNFPCGRQASAPSNCVCAGRLPGQAQLPSPALDAPGGNCRMLSPKIRSEKAADIWIRAETWLRGKDMLPVSQLGASSWLTKVLLSFIDTRFLPHLFFETLSSGDACRWDTGGEGDYPSSFKSQMFKSDLVLIWGEVLMLRLDAGCSYLTR